MDDPFSSLLFVIASKILFGEYLHILQKSFVCSLKLLDKVAEKADLNYKMSQTVPFK